MGKKETKSKYLTGTLLIAMPQMKDARFHHAVIYVCGHDEKGAMGLVVNRLAESITFKNLLEQLNIQVPNLKLNFRIHYGGPIEMGRGFVLHTEDYMHESSVKMGENVVLTATVKILQDIAKGKGPSKFMLALGYAGWSPGQLEQEIQDNGWLQVQADEELLFGENINTRWEQALTKLGVDIAMFSTEAGHA